MAENLDSNQDLVEPDQLTGGMKATPYFEDFLFRLVDDLGGEGSTSIEDLLQLVAVHETFAPLPAGVADLSKRVIELEAFTDKHENITTITPADSPYTALFTDGLIKADITSGNITVVLPTGEDFAGFVFEVKAIADTLPSVNECLVIGEDTGGGAAEVDDDAGGITIDALEAIPFKYDFDANKYWINN